MMALEYTLNAVKAVKDLQVKEKIIAGANEPVAIVEIVEHGNSRKLLLEDNTWLNRNLTDQVYVPVSKVKEARLLEVWDVISFNNRSFQVLFNFPVEPNEALLAGRYIDTKEKAWVIVPRFERIAVENA